MKTRKRPPDIDSEIEDFPGKAGDLLMRFLLAQGAPAISRVSLSKVFAIGDVRRFQTPATQSSPPKDWLFWREQQVAGARKSKKQTTSIAPILRHAVVQSDQTHGQDSIATDLDKGR